MSVLESSINPQSDVFAENHAALTTCINDLRAIEKSVIDMAEKSRPKFEKKGKLLPRERLNLLIDQDSPFIELCGLAGYKMYDDKDGSTAGGGLICGLGYISGVRCIVQVNNCAIKGGTISPAGLDKTLRLQQIALENKLPIVSLAESGGANLNYATDVFVPGARAFANQARLSAAGIPQVTVVHGNATAGGAYQPGLSDYVIAVRNQSKMFLAGPPLLMAATGEVATDEELGGAELHALEAGTADYIAENDADGIRIAREIMASLPTPLNAHAAISSSTISSSTISPTENEYDEPLYSTDELLGVISADPKKPYDVREIIARLVDGSEFQEFKPQFDQQTICGFVRFGAMACGVIGNNGPITHKGANKAAQFIQLCDQSNTPLLFLHNTTGFMVGKESERNGIIKHGSKMLQAVTNARVPKISILIGGSYGAGNYAMCGRGLDPRFIFAWPNSKTAVMGGTQAGKVLRIVTEAKQRSMGMEPDPKTLDMIEQTTAQKLEAGSTALFGTARIWDDGLIDPRDTRRLMIELLDTCQQADNKSLNSNQFGVARF